MRGGLAMATLLAIGCGGSPPAGSSDAGSLLTDAGAFQTAQGYCSSSPTLSGGNLVGTWTIVGACAISTGAPENCTNATVSLSLTAQGTVTFDADQTGAIDVTVAISEDSGLAANCSSGGSCASLQSDLTAGTNGAASATCSTSTTDATRCTCEETYAPYVLQGAGSYTLVRSNYLSSSALSLQGGFLVAGNTLRLDGLGFETTEFDLIGQR